jgi:hypothetical protein
MKNDPKQMTTYSDIVKAGLILPSKKKYTMRDVNSAIVDSIFRKEGTISERQAIFIVKCSAVFHNTTWSDSIMNWREKYPV